MAHRPTVPDHQSVERDWHRRAGIFPMMRAVALHQDLLETTPGLDRAVQDAFVASKEIAADRYRRGRKLSQAPTMLPRANDRFERNQREIGTDWWTYGIVEELFSPALLDT